MNLIETDRLARRFWRTEAVHDLSFAAPAGSVTALLGPNGAGKTTTLKMLVNLLRPTAGVARVLGVDSRELGEREFAQIGYVAENQEQPLWMTVRELLDYCRPFYPSWDRALESRLLEQFDLPPNRKLKHLSRGMLMKAVLISSLAYRPRLLILDEPFTGLDPLVRHEFVTGLLEAAELGDWTMLISSHDIDDVERLTDRVVMLEAGRLRLQESTEQLLGRFRRVEVNGAAAAPPAAPAGWWEYQEKAGRVTFVDPAYAGDASERAYRERFPGAGCIAQPMSLKEIFISLARAGRKEAKGAAA
jgi:ABC-2 type transport system ATP-binding protein